MGSYLITDIKYASHIASKGNIDITIRYNLIYLYFSPPFVGREGNNTLNQDRGDKRGGFIFTSKGYCPDCAGDGMKSIKKYGEEKYIKAICPKDMSFKDFILGYRGGDNTIKITSF